MEYLINTDQYCSLFQLPVVSVLKGPLVLCQYSEYMEVRLVTSDSSHGKLLSLYIHHVPNHTTFCVVESWLTPAGSFLQHTASRRGEHTLFPSYPTGLAFLRISVCNLFIYLIWIFFFSSKEISLNLLKNVIIYVYLLMRWIKYK